MENNYFKAISGEYNFPVQRWYRPFFKSIRAENSGQLGRVLDVGCGRGVAGSSELARRTIEGADEVVGIDPSADLTQAPDHVDSFIQATLSQADLPSEYFDLAYSFMVMEHVKDPEAFFSALREALRPGGVYIFTTPNPRSVFGLSVRAFKYSGLADGVKSLLKGGEGLNHELGYELTSESDIRRCAQGFRCEFAYSETYASYRSYFPGVLRPIWRALKIKRSYWKKPSSLAQLTARCVRAE